jgi:hypothetical protein
MLSVATQRRQHWRALASFGPEGRRNFDAMLIITDHIRRTPLALRLDGSHRAVAIKHNVGIGTTQ